MVTFTIEYFFKPISNCINYSVGTDLNVTYLNFYAPYDASLGEQ